MLSFRISVYWVLCESADQLLELSPLPRLMPYPKLRHRYPGAPFIEMCAGFVQRCVPLLTRKLEKLRT
jgi:hypothetical protein